MFVSTIEFAIIIAKKAKKKQIQPLFYTTQKIKFLEIDDLVKFSKGILNGNGKVPFLCSIKKFFCGYFWECQGE